MQDDADDLTDFMQGMEKLFGYTHEQIDDIITSIRDPNALIDLSQALSRNDRIGARTVLMRQGIEEDREVIAGPTVRPDAKKTPTRDKDGRQLVVEREPVTHTVGCAVVADGHKGLVMIPDAPGGTVGVKMTTDSAGKKTKGKILMFKKDNVELDKSDDKKLKENVMTFTNMDLARLGQLAGIPQLPPPAPEPVAPRCAQDDTDPVTACMQAIETLKATLPTITVAQLSPIRKELYGLTTMLNEARRGPRA